MKKAVMYGAGNIGRGFIGQLFSESGYEIVFIDVNMDVVNRLNMDRSYPIRVVSGKEQREVLIQNVRAINGMDAACVSSEISDADIMATAVGVNVLSRIIPNIVEGLKNRWSSSNLSPLNIIICENLLDADKYIEEQIKKLLTLDEAIMFEKLVGIVEASIGRMVPVMTPMMQEGNVLRVWVESYNTLTVNKTAFKGNIPDIVNMIPFSPFDFYIHRKLFVHNLGHAITSYLGYSKGYRYIWEAIGEYEIYHIVKSAMNESSEAISKEYCIPIEELHAHVEDLLIRFGNRHLGDTVERVGKDPIRKLSRNDRLIGAGLLCVKNGIAPNNIFKGIMAAFNFHPRSDEAATQLQRMIAENGMEMVLKTVCGIADDEWNSIKPSS